MSGSLRAALRTPWIAFAVVGEFALGRMRQWAVGRHTSALLVECDQGRFLTPPDDWTVGRRMAHGGSYGAEEIRRILALTDAGSRVLVVGSHIGSLVVPIARQVAHVTAIEANPATFELLKMNLKLNGCDNVDALHLAAGEREGEIELVMNTTNSGGSKRLPLVKRHIYFYDRPQVARVRLGRLDDVLPGAYDLILMDIEGSEYFALQGMPRLLAQAKHLVVEFLPRHFRDVAGVTAKDFAALLQPHFDRLFVPSRNETVQKSGIVPLLARMDEEGAEDDGIVFSKA